MVHNEFIIYEFYIIVVKLIDEININHHIFISFNLLLTII